MKKSLSLILALAMVFSMFASVAFAAETTTTPKTTEEKYAELEKLGIFEGDGTGANLEGEMDRAQLAKIVAKLKNLSEDKAANTYSDVPADHWAAGFIGAVTKAGIFDGVAEGQFDPAGKVTLEQLAKVLVVTAGLTESTDAVTGVVSDWAKGYVAAAVKAFGLTQADYTVNAIRGVFVELTYEALDAINGSVKAEVSAKIVGAKKIEVTFNKAVDTAKAEFSLKKGSITATINKTSYNDAKTVFTLETSIPLSKGEYTLTVGGVVSPAYTQTFTVEDEKVVSIQFASDKASLDRTTSKTIHANYKVLNQYGEDISKNKAITFTSTKGTASGSNGELTVTTGTYGSDYLLNETVAVSALHDSGVYAQQTLTVSAVAKVATMEVKGLYNKDSKTPEVGKNPGDFAIEIIAKDQYGNKVPASLIGDDVVVTNSNNSILTIPSVSNKVTFTTDTDREALLRLAAPDVVIDTATGAKATNFVNAGKSTVYIMSTTSGNRVEFTVDVAAAGKVDVLSLNTPELAVAGEDVKIPFTSADQFGKELGKAADLAGLSALDFSVSGAGLSKANLKFVADYANDKVELVLDAKTATVSENAQQVFINGVVNNKLVQLNFNLQPKAEPKVILSVDEVTGAVAQGGLTTIKYDKIKVQDQYGRTKTFKDFSTDYVINLSTSTSNKLVLSAAQINGTVQSATVTAAIDTATDKFAGYADVTLKLRAKNAAATASDIDVRNISIKNVKIDEIVGYEVAQVGKVYAKPAANAADYSVDLKVNGLLADGTKVTVPAPTGSAKGNDYYSVTDATYLAYAGGKLTASPAIDFGTGTEKTFGIVVVGNAKDGAQDVKSQNVVVSKDAPVAAKFELQAATNITKKSDTVVAASQATVSALNKVNFANSVIKVTDQYGKNPVTNATSVYVSKEFNVAETGNTINVTAVIDGQTYQFKLVVE